jgi:hypothetical protein
MPRVQDIAVGRDRVPARRREERPAGLCRNNGQTTKGGSLPQIVRPCDRPPSSGPRSLVAAKSTANVYSDPFVREVGLTCRSRTTKF